MYYTIEQLNNLPERFSNKELISLHRKNRLHRIMQYTLPIVGGAGYFGYATYIGKAFFSFKKLAVVVGATTLLSNYYLRTKVEFEGKNFEDFIVVDAYRRRHLEDRMFALGYGGDHYSYTDTIKNPQQKPY